jgi:hypothetical protein
MLIAAVAGIAALLCASVAT